MFTLYSDTGCDSTMVSNLFIDEYMKSANDAQIKIYLYLLRMMGVRRAASISDMADQFNHTEKDVIRSLRYWERQGLLNLTFSKENDLVSIRLCRPEPSDSGRHAGVDTASPSGPRILPFASPGESSSDGLTHRDSLQLVSGDPFPNDSGRAQLLFVIEQYIGKPLSPREVSTVCSISETLHFSDDLIDYLIQYCVDRGKKDFRFIKKVAENWAEQGIMTPAQAEASAAKTSTAKASAAKQTAKKQAARPRPANSFNQFEQNTYDFDALEEELLGSAGAAAAKRQ